MRKKLRDSQQIYFNRLQDLAERGEIWFVHRPCPCGQGGADTIIACRDRYALPVNSVLCQRCGTVRLDPYFDDESLRVFYTEIYQELYGRSNDPAEYSERQKVYGLKIIQNLCDDRDPSQSRILEIGCGAGGAVSVFQEKGFQAAGCDYSEELIAYGTSQGIQNLLPGTVDQIPVPIAEEQKYDLIYLHHVLEHVGHPLLTLHRIKQLLKSDGKILIIVPDLYRIDQHKREPNDCMEFFHIAHKWNFTRECFASLSNQLSMIAKEVEPVGQRTAWSDAPELWIVIQSQSQAENLPWPEADVGERYFNYLISVENQFASKDAISEPAIDIELPDQLERDSIRPSRSRSGSSYYDAALLANDKSCSPV